MNKDLELYNQELDISEEWMDDLAIFILFVDKLIKKKVKDEEDRIDYGDDLAKALNRLSKFTYLVRGERDHALAAGYVMYPKGQYNSDAQVALARNHASEEVRLRGLLEEMEAAIKLRASLNQSALAYFRTIAQYAGA
jgi:hypothetical protein